MKKHLFFISLFLFLIFFALRLFFYFTDFNIYGIPVLCSSIGGIWCYWPALTDVLNGTLIVVALILLWMFLRKK